MRRIATFVLLMIFSLTICAAGQAAEKAKKKGKGKGKDPRAVALFDGTSLDAWDYHLVDPNVKKEDVWSIDERVLVCKGEPLGYLATKQDFQNFKLTLQWRWAPGKEPGKLRAAAEPIGFMPKCAEAQLRHGSAGDIWGFRGFKVEGPADRAREVKNHEALGDFKGVAAMKRAEKEPGEWNTYEITFQDDKLTVSINGELVNEATGCDVVRGKIGLQSEGGEIHFRRVRIVPL
jgi:hypothetical protein